jgi:hypothetical protein
MKSSISQIKNSVEEWMCDLISIALALQCRGLSSNCSPTNNLILSNNPVEILSYGLDQEFRILGFESKVYILGHSNKEK